MNISDTLKKNNLFSGPMTYICTQIEPFEHYWKGATQASFLFYNKQNHIALE